MDEIIFSTEREIFYLDKSKSLRPGGGLRNVEQEVVLYGIAGLWKHHERRGVFFLVHPEVSVLKDDWKKILGLC